MFELLFDLDFPVVVVFSGNWIVSEEEATAHYPSKNMTNSNFARIEDFGSRYASHMQHPPKMCCVPMLTHADRTAAEWILGMAIPFFLQRRLANV